MVPGDSRSFLAGTFESAGLDLGDRTVNPWTLSYMTFHFGVDWVWQLLFALGRSVILATFSALLSLLFVVLCFGAFSEKRLAWMDVLAGLLFSLVSVLVAPLLAVIYTRKWGVGATPAGDYLFAAISICFVASGSYLKFLTAKLSQLEVRELLFGLRARGVPASISRWRHSMKLLLPDFTVLFLSRYSAYLSGVFVAEIVFNIRGLGWYFSQAFQSRSGLLLLLLVLISSVFYLLLNHLALFLSARIDPRRSREN